MTTFWSRFCAGAILAMAPSVALSEPMEIYIDADFSTNTTGVASIELGLATALSEVDNRLAGQEVVLRPMDHRGNVRRSKRNLEAFDASETALAVVGGLNSPPYLTHRSFINESEIPLLLPWSAAGPVTRAPEGEENWIFRLSVDDSQSGAFFVKKAVEEGGCERLALLLLDTGWGRANNASLTAALTAIGQSPAVVEFFPGTVGRAAARTLVENVARVNADCAVLVASWTSGSVVTNAIAERIPDLRLFSHWGILGGAFVEQVPHEVRSRTQFSVLQTCGLRREAEQNPVLEHALTKAFGGGTRLSEIAAPTGFVHGYDLAKVLIAAAEQASKDPRWAEGIIGRRRALRAALQQLETPVEGILDRYDPPFTPYVEVGSDAHEALGLKHLCMARFDETGALEDAG